ncbi:MAG: prolyl oligopeptidase family serine peptidase, partial [Firmicutes bacterium]|nr:prolyl oligopeptidase family serine peptidase [Bacillota bacterium]
VLEELRACPGIISAEPEEAPVQYEGRVKCWSIRYVSDDCEVTGYVAIPSKLEGDLISVPEEGIEGLVYCRGGNRDYSALTPLELCKQVATAGYAAFGSQYRGNKGGTGSEDFGGDDVHDVTNLIDIALQLPFIKGEKVYLVGFSRGGMMAYRACQDYGDKIAACSINSGIADSYIMYESRGDDMKLVYHLLVGGGPEELPEEFDRRSATKWADEINVPLLIGQGTADVKVVPEQAYAMADALKAADKTEGEDYRLVIFEGATHGLANTTFMKEQLDWFAGFPIE